jgi:small-conductance mechanosensitive channel
MDIQQSIYFAIHEAFEQEQIDFAYPTQKLFVAQTSM